VAVIKPFRALRPVPEKAEQVSCVPYDVISVDEARAIIDHNPLSFLRVTRPEGDSSGDAATAEQFNAAARDHLEQLIADGVLVTESEPAVYIYRLDTGSHSQTGIVACCSLDEYANAQIKRHEKTRPDKVEDRTNHMIAVGAQTGLIFLAFRGTESISEIVAAEVANKRLYDFKCEKGVRQTVWKVEKTSELVNAFSEVPAIYIADGHHRAESALRAREVLRAKNPDHTGGEEYNFVIAGIFPAEDLKILPYNRVVRDLNGLSDEEFMARHSENFVVTGTGKDTPENHGEICVYLSGTWHTLKFAVDYIREPDPIERLDVSILQNYVLAPILGVGDPRTDERIGFIGGSRGTKELVNLVDRGDARVAFSMFPTTMADLLSVSDADEIMPPKSTWFEPKLKDGLLIHTI
jgi:uncharacterized protein (DUF1015 family)